MPGQVMVWVGNGANDDEKKEAPALVDKRAALAQPTTEEHDWKNIYASHHRRTEGHWWHRSHRLANKCRSRREGHVMSTIPVLRPSPLAEGSGGRYLALQERVDTSVMFIQQGAAP